MVVRKKLDTEENQVKHLIPHMQDNNQAADYLRQLRWPNGIGCPHCGSPNVEQRERCPKGGQRYHCPACARRLAQRVATFNDWTDTIFEDSKLEPVAWVLVRGL